MRADLYALLFYQKDKTMFQLNKFKLATILVPVVLMGCATGDTPDSKKMNAREETQSALQEIYKEHPAAKSAVAESVGYVVCTGSNTFLFALSTGGGVCVLHEGSKNSYYRFATGGVGAGIGWKQLAFVQAFMDKDALARYKESGYEGQAQAEASAKYDESGDQASANQSVDVTGVKTYQVNLMGAAAQATVQGYKYWETDFSDDFIEKEK
ncbi:MAG: lipid-binding SYLF domain-containing protein [Shewanella sp.]